MLTPEHRKISSPDVTAMAGPMLKPGMAYKDLPLTFQQLIDSAIFLEECRGYPQYRPSHLPRFAPDSLLGERINRLRIFYARDLTAKKPTSHLIDSADAIFAQTIRMQIKTHQDDYDQTRGSNFSKLLRSTEHAAWADKIHILVEALGTLPYPPSLQAIMKENMNEMTSFRSMVLAEQQGALLYQQR